VTLLGAAFLVPLAASRRALRGLRPVIVPIIVVAVLDMAAPTFLTAWGEQHVSSSVAGILTATDPLLSIPASRTGCSTCSLTITYVMPVVALVLTPAQGRVPVIPRCNPALPEAPRPIP